MAKTKKSKVVQVPLRSAIQQLGLSPVWVRRQLTKGIGSLVGSKVDGKWVVTQASIDTKLAQMAAKEAKREAIRRGEISYGYSRPSQKTIQMMRTKVAADPVLTEDEKTFFEVTLDRYADEYEAAYITRKAQQNS